MRSNNYGCLLNAVLLFVVGGLLHFMGFDGNTLPYRAIWAMFIILLLWLGKKLINTSFGIPFASTWYFVYQAGLFVLSFLATGTLMNQLFPKDTLITVPAFAFFLVIFYLIPRKIIELVVHIILKIKDSSR